MSPSTTFLSIVILAALVQHSVSATLFVGSWFKVESVCGPGDFPSSEVVNISSITELGEQTFGQYMQQSIPMTFQNSNKTALSGASADAEWESLVPKNNGFLTKKIGNNTIHFGISAFHAIHCLDTLRRTVEVQFDVASAKTMASAQSNPGENSFYYLQHCLIYLREMVMCDADPTLEHDVLYQNGMTIMGGDGMTHTCRDFKALSAMSDESEVTAGTGCTGLGV